MHHEKKGDLLVMEFRVFYVFARFRSGSISSSPQGSQGLPSSS